MSDGDVLELAVRVERKGDEGVDVSFRVIKGAKDRVRLTASDLDRAADVAALALAVDYLSEHPEVLLSAVGVQGASLSSARLRVLRKVKTMVPERVWSRLFKSYEEKLQARRGQRPGRGET